MNLFDGSDLSELYRLVAGCNDDANFYDLLVGHDGEVRIVSTSRDAKHSMAGCRFYFKACLHGNSSPESHNQKFLNQLYKNLLYCWEHDMQGALNQDDIIRWQNYSYWLRNSRSHHGLVRLRHFTDFSAIKISPGLQMLPVKQQQTEAPEEAMVRNN